MTNKMISVLKSNRVTGLPKERKVNSVTTGFYVDPLADEIKELKKVSTPRVYLSMKFKWPLNDETLCGTDEMINMENHYLQVYCCFPFQ